MSVEINPTFAETELKSLIKRVDEALQSLQIQLDAVNELMASPLATEDETVMAGGHESRLLLERSIRVQQFQLAQYATRLKALEKAANGRKAP